MVVCGSLKMMTNPMNFIEMNTIHIAIYIYIIQMNKMNVKITDQHKHISNNKF